MHVIEPYLVNPSDGVFQRDSTATYHDSAGVLKYAAVDEQRPIFEAAGSSNLLAYSNNWQAGSNCSVTNAGATGPDNTLNAALVSLDTFGQYEVINTSVVTLVAGSVYGVSVYLELLYSNGKNCYAGVTLGGASLLRLNLGAAAPTITYKAVGVSNETISILYGKRIRVEFVLVAASTASASFRIRFGAADQYVDGGGQGGSNYLNGQKIAVFGGQVETLGVSSYIPTNGVPVGRAPEFFTIGSTTGSQLIYTSVAAGGYGIWSAGTAYAAGQKVIMSAVGAEVYEALSASTGVNPATDTTGKWGRVGKVNRWLMFDGQMSTFTSNPDEITVTIRPDKAVDSLVLFGVVGYKVTVTVVDDYEGAVYTKTLITRTRTLPAISYWDFIHARVDQRETVVLLDLPLSKFCTVTVQIANLAGHDAQCAMCLLGRADEIGVAQYGTGGGISDYSVKERDQWGNWSVVQRGYADRADFPVFIDSRKSDYVKKKLTQYRSIPCVYVGSLDYELSVVYGFFKAIYIVLKGMQQSEYNLEVEGI